MLAHSHQAEGKLEAELPDLTLDTRMRRIELCEYVTHGQPCVSRDSLYIVGLILQSLPAGIR